MLYGYRLVLKAQALLCVLRTPQRPILGRDLLNPVKGQESEYRIKVCVRGIFYMTNVLSRFSTINLVFKERPLQLHLRLIAALE